MDVQEYKEQDVKKLLKFINYPVLDTKYSKNYEDNIRLLEAASRYQKEKLFRFFGIVDYFVDKKDLQDKDTNQLFSLIATIIQKQLNAEQPEIPFGFSGDNDEGAFAVVAYLKDLKEAKRVHDWIFRKGREVVKIGWQVDFSRYASYQIQMGNQTLSQYELRKTIVNLMRNGYRLMINKNTLIGACVQCHLGAMNFICGNCYQVTYCSEPCQRNHWNKHNC